MALATATQGRPIHYWVLTELGLADQSLTPRKRKILSMTRTTKRRPSKDSLDELPSRQVSRLDPANSGSSWGKWHNTVRQSIMAPRWRRSTGCDFKSKDCRFDRHHAIKKHMVKGNLRAVVVCPLCRILEWLLQVSGQHSVYCVARYNSTTSPTV